MDVLHPQNRLQSNVHWQGNTWKFFLSSKSIKAFYNAKLKCFYHLYAMYVYILVKDHLYLSSSYSMVNKRWRWQFFRHIDVPLTHTLHTIFKLYLFGWTNIHQCRRRTTVVYVSKLNCNLSFFFKLNFMKVYQSLRRYCLGRRSIFKSIKYFRSINELRIYNCWYIDHVILEVQTISNRAQSFFPFLF